MQRRSRLQRGPRLAVCAVLLATGGLLTQLIPDFVKAQTRAISESERPRWVQINDDGFGDCMNAYPWSMAWFKGRLYVGTGRGHWVGVLGDRDFHCRKADVAAEIWRYTAETSTWERVFKSPDDVPISGQPGRFIARDHGFRHMTVFTEADGTEALYVGGVVYSYVFPGTDLRPRILRSTDGITFEPIPQDPGTVLGDLQADSFRAMAVYKGRLYVTAGSVLGEGTVLEASTPAGGNNHFRQVSPPGLLAFELAVFNGFLYVGSSELLTLRGFTVYKTDAIPSNTVSYRFIPVVTNGAYGHNPIVMSMKILNGRLYAGGFTDLIRINPDDTWDLVVGDPRQTPQGVRFPLSGLPGGFGNPFVRHLWRMEWHKGWFYVGTADFSVFLRNLPILGPIAAPEAGFDLWRTKDGVFWTQITRNGFGDKFNYGVRGLQSTPLGLFLGSVNPWTGTQVWLSPDSAARGVQRPGGIAEWGHSSMEPPERVEAERQGGVTVLSWDRAPAAVRFHVFRAAYQSNRELGIRELPEETWFARPYMLMGTTTEPVFRDSTIVPGDRYAYYVQAEGRAGAISDPSNMAIGPPLAPVVTFDRAETAIADLAGRGTMNGASGATPLSRFLAAGRAAVVRGDWASARRWLAALQNHVVTQVAPLDALAAEDLEIMVARLVRRVALAQAGVISVWDVVNGQSGDLGQ